MGSDDLFKKRRAERKKRKYGYLQPKANSFLIVTEGERTEPLYFKGLQKLISEKMGGSVDIYEVPLIDIHGEGCATNSLIKKAEEIVQKSKTMYQNVWIVFDKDDFQDFDEAIQCGLDKGYKIAWSNQSFEYWLFLHFEYSDAALHRDDWKKKLSAIFQKLEIGDGSYHKNDESIFSMVNQHDGLGRAIQHARGRWKEFDPEKDRPSSFDPGTTVHLLAEELKSFLDE